MLCSKFIFTNPGADTGAKLHKIASENGNVFKVVLNDNVAELCGDADDEQLYNMCCGVSEYILESMLKSSIYNMLSKTYGCFNRDEAGKICTQVMEKEFCREFPGRMYVYVKVNHTVNPAGFYMFMCRDVEKNALICAADEADRILRLNDEEEMIETLKYFSDMSPESVSKVIIFASPTNIEIRECIPEIKRYHEEYAVAETDVLAELVTLNPACIEIYGKDNFLKNEVSAVIEAVFGGRIQYR